MESLTPSLQLSCSVQFVCSKCWIVFQTSTLRLATIKINSLSSTMELWRKTRGLVSSLDLVRDEILALLSGVFNSLISLAVSPTFCFLSSLCCSFVTPGIANNGADLSTATVYRIAEDDVPDSSFSSRPSFSKLHLLLGIGVLSTSILLSLTWVV